MSYKYASVIGAITIGSTLFRKSINKKSDCSAKKNDNSAFVFIKPHANTTSAQNLVKNSLLSKGINISQEGEISGEKIDQDMLIDQHYYAIASKATLLKPEKMPVSPQKFQEAFGLSWESVLQSGQAYNALDACAYLGNKNFEDIYFYMQYKFHLSKNIKRFGFKWAG